MLGQIFRGIFLISILTWYSTSVWKLIDGYFKDQFQSYLEEEYRKNPRMRSDVQRLSAGKVSPAPTTPGPESAVTVPRDAVEACEIDVCPVEIAETDSPDDRAAQREPPEPKEIADGTSENGAAQLPIDKNAFLEAASEPGLESRKPTGNDTDDEELRRDSINHDQPDRVEGKKAEVSPGLKSTPTPASPRRRATKYVGKLVAKEKEPPKEAPKERPVARKRKVKTIVLTEKDFATAKKGEVADDDFWEFEEEGEEKEPVEGILVSELPFKPRADIGDLDRVTAEEYCPMTLEEEASCGDTFKWP